MPVELILYSTLGCHLCEHAEEMIAATLAPQEYRLHVVEISESDELIAKYGVRIPVMKRADMDAELGWPFLPQDILKLIAIGQ